MKIQSEFQNIELKKRKEEFPLKKTKFRERKDQSTPETGLYVHQNQNQNRRKSKRDELGKNTDLTESIRSREEQ